MVRGLILYYLNMKSTHGYEIQRFIQLSGMDQWTRIQSGSIYYALARLEKEKNIEVQREEQVGARIRKIYRITDQGRKTLREEMKAALEAPIMECSSFKFIIDPMLASLDKEEISAIIKKHLKELEKKQEYWEQWREIKAPGETKGLSRLSFDMALHSIEDQIAWHQELLENLDFYQKQSNTLREVIQRFEPETVESMEKRTGTNETLQFAESLRDALREDPEAALNSLNQMIEEMKKNQVK